MSTHNICFHRKNENFMAEKRQPIWGYNVIICGKNKKHKILPNYVLSTNQYLPSDQFTKSCLGVCLC